MFVHEHIITPLLVCCLFQHTSCLRSLAASQSACAVIISFRTKSRMTWSVVVSSVNTLFLLVSISLSWFIVCVAFTQFCTWPPFCVFLLILVLLRLFLLRLLVFLFFFLDPWSKGWGWEVSSNIIGGPADWWRAI